MNKVLFLNHKKQRCGVYQHALGVYNVIKNSKQYDYKYFETESFDEVENIVKKEEPYAIIYFYHTQVAKHYWDSRYKRFGCKNICVLIDSNQQSIQSMNNDIYDSFISMDVTIEETPIVYKCFPLIRQFNEDIELYNKEIPVIGSAGFVTGIKMFDRLVAIVQNEFNEAIIRLHLPQHFYGVTRDATGNNSNDIYSQLKSRINKQNIKLEVTQTFLSPEDLLRFFAQNWINVFLYISNFGHSVGLASSVDYALSAKRPVAITNSPMFRHLEDLKPLISVDQGNTLKQIIDRGLEPYRNIYEKWSSEKFIENIDRIITNTIKK